MDTVTLIRSAMRSLLKVADDALEIELRAALTSGEDYANSAKPQIDWNDNHAREALIDSRAKDAFACLAALDGRELSLEVVEAARLLAQVVGQDLEAGDDGVLRIARNVAKDRVISTVDPDARHGHKTAARAFDGYKGHAAVDPDSEIITATTVTPGNAGDASVAEDLIADLLGGGDVDHVQDLAVQDAVVDEGDTPQDDCGHDGTPVVYGDNAYGTGEFQERLEDADIESRCKTQKPTTAGGLFSKDRFDVDLEAGTVTCPNGVTAEIRRHRDSGGMAYFGDACGACPLRDQCTSAAGGRTIGISRHEGALGRARTRQADPDWIVDYRATRPKVERKLAHLMRRKHGGRRARVRGRDKVDADFNLLGAAANLARLAVLGLRGDLGGRWAIA
jgi:hypothetical protein